MQGASRAVRNDDHNGRVQLTTPVRQWTVLVPLKSTARGKSRLAARPALRRALARAMALDTVEAAAAAAGVDTVLVLANDRSDAQLFVGIPGVRPVLTRADGLNDAILDGCRFLRHGRVVVLPADLPSLRADELGDALISAQPLPLAVVADRHGSGSTLLAATSVRDLLPRYGPGSFERHVAAGAVPLELPLSSGLRRDVDVNSDLAGVTGWRTLALLAEVPAANRSALLSCPEPG